MLMETHTARERLRLRLLVWSAPPAPSCGGLQRRGSRSSLRHCCVVLCYGVVAGLAPVRYFTTTWTADSDEIFLDALPWRGSCSPCLSVLCFYLSVFVSLLHVHAAT